jgi:hypothetical protein
VVFLGVFIQSKENQIRSFAESTHISFPVGLDGGIARKLRAVGVPTTFFISRDGSVAKRHVGVGSYSRIIMGVEEILR